MEYLTWEYKSGTTEPVIMDWFRINLLDDTIYILIAADFEGEKDIKIVSKQKQKSSRVLGQLEDINNADLKREITEWMNMSPNWDNDICDNPGIIELVMENHFRN